MRHQCSCGSTPVQQLNTKGANTEQALNLLPIQMNFHANTLQALLLSDVTTDVLVKWSMWTTLAKVSQQAILTLIQHQINIKILTLKKH